MAKILVIRFSAIGDVAMTIPVIYSFAVQYPQHQITVLSRNTLAPLFDGLPPNITFHGVDLKGEHAGIMGLEWIYKDLKKEHFDAVADFHDVLRSKYLRIRFRLAGSASGQGTQWKKEIGTCQKQSDGMAKVVIPTICRGIPEYRLSGKIKFPIAFRQGQGKYLVHAAADGRQRHGQMDWHCSVCRPCRQDLSLIQARAGNQLAV